MELSQPQAREINALTRAYYDALASELNIINPSSDLEAYKTQLVTAITNLARGVGGVAPTYRRVVRAPRPAPRQWNLSSVVTREVRRNLTDILTRVNQKQLNDTSRLTPDDVFRDIEKLIIELKALPQKSATHSRLPVSTSKMPTLPVVPKLATPTRVPSPRIPSMRGTSAPSRPPSRATTPILIPPSSDIEVNMLLDRMRDLAPAMINKSAEIARILGLDETGLREGLSVFMERP